MAGAGLGRVVLWVAEQEAAVTDSVSLQLLERRSG